MRLSIIILTHNRLDDTVKCIESLRPVATADDVEVIIVDNGSVDGTPDHIAEHFPDIKLIVNASNRGIAVARNQGIAESVGEKVLILDNDTIVNEQAIVGMEEYLDAHPQVGLCACRMTDAAGNVQPSYRPFPSITSKVLGLLGLRSARAQFKFDDEGCIEPFYVIGACQMMRREAMKQTGVLDEAIFYGPEDADYCYRMRQAGWQIKYLPQFAIVHSYQRCTSRHPLSRLGIKHIKGLMHLYRKYHRLK